MSVVVIKHAGKEIPEEFLSKVLAKHSKCGGIAWTSKGRIVTGKANKPIDLDWAKEFNGPEWKDDLLLMSFEDLEKAVSEDDISPMVMVSTLSDEPLVVAALEGDFSPKEMMDSAHPPAYHAGMDYLAKKLTREFKNHDDELERLWKDGLDDFFQKEMLTCIGPGGGSITLMSSAGKILTVSVGHAFVDYSWGRASASCGYGEAIAGKPIEVPKDDKKSKMSRLFGGSKPEVQGTMRPPEPVTKTVPVISQTGNTTVIPKGARPDTAINENTNKGTPMPGAPGTWTPPALMNNKNLKKEYKRRNLGICPANWEERPTIFDHTSPALKSLQDLPQPAPVDKPVEAKPDAAPAPQEEPKPVVQPPAPAPEATKLVDTPFISGDEKKRFTDLRATLDNNSRKIITHPSMIPSLEAEWPSATEAMALKGLEEPLGWKIRSLIRFNSDCPKLMALYMLQLGDAYGKALVKLEQYEKDMDKRTTPDPVQQQEAPKAVAAGGGKRKLFN